MVVFVIYTDVTL